MIESNEKRQSYIFASLLTGVYDVNRNELLKNDDFQIIEQWYQSVMSLNLNAIIFHNNFSDKTVAAYQNEHISFVRVEYDGKLNANIQRYIFYQDFVSQHFDRIENI